MQTVIPNPTAANRKSHSGVRPGTLPLVALVLVALLVAAFVRWWPRPATKPDPTWTQMLASGVFRIGMDPSFPPFEADDGQGNLSGLDIALAQEMVNDWSIQEKTSLKVQYVYTGFDGLYDALKSGQFDAIISALPYDPKKTEDVSFSHAYFNGGPLVVVRDTDTTTKSWYDLAHRRVGIELGSNGDSFARKWERRLDYDLHEYETPAEALQALRTGQVDGVLTDEITFEDFQRTAGDVKMVGRPLTDELIVVAVRKDSPTLLQQINAVVDAMKRDGRMQKLQVQWF